MHPLIVIIIGFVIVYMGSCMIHPYRACKTCRRSRESHSTTFKGAFGKCRTCRGVGHHIRVGARLLGRKS